MYEIKLLGTGQVSYDGKLIPGFPGQQHCLLFYYLILNRQISHTREQVATIFWGDYPSTTARKNLRNTLWRLSQSFRSVGASLADLLMSQDDVIAFTKTDQYRLDIDQFELAARFSLEHASREMSAEQVSILEIAVDLYKGDLLESVYEDWCIYERERLRLALLNILTRLMNYHSRTGNYERSLEYGKHILQLDSTRESVHRQMMVIHCLAGDREAAIVQYRSCCQILQAELRIKPMHETQLLYENILQHGYSENIEVNTDRLSNSPLREMLQKLHFLEMIVEHANTELHLLEGMIHQFQQTDSYSQKLME
jgi:DNA-binding SARP family transcriptional activator